MKFLKVHNFLLLSIFFVINFDLSLSMSLNDFLMNPLAGVVENHKILPLLPSDDQKPFYPDFIKVSIKKHRNDEDERDEIFNGDNQSRQIPVISDIERFKKVIEIIEFVGEKVGDILDKIQLPSSDEPSIDYRNSEGVDVNTSTVVNSQETEQ